MKEVPYPTVIIRKHVWESCRQGGRSVHCYHCGACHVSDLGGGDYFGPYECVEREIRDPRFGLTEEEFAYFGRFCAYRWSSTDGLWNIPYSTDTYTTEQLKERFKKMSL